jgi:hypothetical protein
VQLKHQLRPDQVEVFEIGFEAHPFGIKHGADGTIAHQNFPVYSVEKIHDYFLILLLVFLMLSG